jgi:KRAB domain-containing zinc finger protein
MNLKVLFILVYLYYRCTEHGDKREYKCEKCGTSFSTKDDLGKHRKRKTTEKSFTCDTCGVKLHAKIDLKAHMDTHTGEKSFVCGTCGKHYRHRVSYTFI